MRHLMYKSTRGGTEPVTASEAILKGLADDGGLFVPEGIPKLELPPEQLGEMSYKEIAFEVMRLFLTDYTEEELKHCISLAYDDKFDTEEIAPITKADGYYYMELYHGATIAFKDMALSILPHLLTTAAEKNKAAHKIIILTATSGDTGKAAMSGFADVEGTGIIVFYPKDGVSYIQERQMVTQTGNNTQVVAIEGNFDDAQNGVKAIFNNKELAAALAGEGYQFSSANSINIGRLIPQIVYYVYGYARLAKRGDVPAGGELDVCVPTGNFGNILAAFYAKQMGIPLGRLICASNDNKVLYDFFQTGEYNRNREFVLTISPSMDILVSSNLERLIYLLTGENPDENRRMMEALAVGGSYSLSPQMKQKLYGYGFVSGYATEEETCRSIHDLHGRTGYVIDTHTAVADVVARRYAGGTEDGRTVLIMSTASPYKFADSVMHALYPAFAPEDEWKGAEELEKVWGRPWPKAISGLKDAPLRHSRCCAADRMQAVVEEILEKHEL